MLLRLTEWLSKSLKKINLSNAGMGALRVVLLFGSAAVAFTLLLTPDGERRPRQAILDPGIDHIVTSSFGSSNNAYQARRGTFRFAPETGCIISRDGSKRGDC